MTTRTVHDPFTGQAVQVSNRLKDRLRGRYAVGPTMPNGEPEFGWRQHDVPPVQLEAADYIETLEAALQKIAVAHSIDGANAIARAARAPEQDK